MADIKTKVNNSSVQAFLEGVEDERKREDCFILVKLMEEVVREEARMWGDAIVGFGSYHYKYDSGYEGDMPLVAFSPRKANLTLYTLAGSSEEDVLLNRLGKHRLGKSCLYIKTLKDVDLDVLKQMVERSVKHMRETNPG